MQMFGTFFSAPPGIITIIVLPVSCQR